MAAPVSCPLAGNDGLKRTSLRCVPEGGPAVLIAETVGFTGLYLPIPFDNPVSPKVSCQFPTGQ